MWESEGHIFCWGPWKRELDTSIDSPLKNLYQCTRESVLFVPTYVDAHAYRSDLQWSGGKTWCRRQTILSAFHRHINCARYSHFWVFDSYGNRPPWTLERWDEIRSWTCISCDAFIFWVVYYAENWHFEYVNPRMKVWKMMFLFSGSMLVFRCVAFVPEMRNDDIGMRENHSKFWIQLFGKEDHVFLSTDEDLLFFLWDVPPIEYLSMHLALNLW